MPSVLGDADGNILAGAPADLPSSVPNADGWFNRVAGVLEATALRNGFAAGGAAGVEDPFEWPKLNIDFDDASDVVGTAV